MRKTPVLLTFGLLFTSVLAHADSISITVTPWLAPNAAGSPSFPGAAQNAIFAEENGLSTFGPAGPTQYNANSTVLGSQGIVTGFNSWMGIADPTNPAYANESGNRMTFGLSILGNGNQFSISELEFGASSSDPDNLLGFGLPGDPSYGPGGYDYSSDYVGILYGADGKLGGGDDTLITGGDSSQLVDALFSRGSGNSFPALCPGCTTAQEQAAIKAAEKQAGSDPYTFTGTYSLVDANSNLLATGSGTFNILPTPEPSTLVLMSTGLLGFAGKIRRHLRKS